MKFFKPGHLMKAVNLAALVALPSFEPPISVSPGRGIKPANQQAHARRMNERRFTVIYAVKLVYCVLKQKDLRIETG